MTVPVVVLGSGLAMVACGDVPTGGLEAITAEGWYRILAISAANRPLVSKYGNGGHEWALYATWDGRAYFAVFSVGGINVAYSAVETLRHNQWTHVAGCYDGVHCKIWIDGSDATAGSRVAGGVVAATAEPVRIGGYISDAAVGFVGRIGWQRLSDSCRYSGPLTGPDAPPPVDSHTIAQWNVTESSGSVVDNAEGTAGYDGQITSGVWATAVANNKDRALPVVSGQFGRAFPIGVGCKGV